MPSRPLVDSAGVIAGPAAGQQMALLLCAAAGWLLGSAWQLGQRELAPPAVLALCAAAPMLLLLVPMLAVWLRRRAPRRQSLPLTPTAALLRNLLCLLCLFSAAAAAYAVVSWRAQARLAERLPAALEGADLVVTGTVAQLPRTGVQGTQFLFEVESALHEGAAVALPPLLSLGWYRSAEPDALLLGPQVDVRAGQRWRLPVRLKQPHGAFNPGGFDLELWLFERGIGATGQVRSRGGVDGNEGATLLARDVAAPVERLRQRVRDAIEQRFSDARTAGVIAALAIGDQAAIERDDWDLFRITGIAHLMSISGLHVTMFAWLAAGLVGWLWRRSAKAMVHVPAPLAARWGGVALALAYALVAGWGVPAQRTVIMLAALAVLQSAAVRWPLHAALLFVATVVVCADPWALLQPGFWLSFMAVALLVASEPAQMKQEAQEAKEAQEAQHARQAQQPPHAPGRGDSAAACPSLLRRAASVIVAALRTQAVATVGLAPLSLVFFQQISLVGFIANLVAIPIVTLLVTPLALLGVLVPVLWDAAGGVLALLMPALRWLAGGDSSALVPVVWQAAAAPPWAVVAGLLGALVAVLPLPLRLRLLALPLMCPLLAPTVPRPAEGRFELVALDIGQGTAALVRTRRHLLVYDTGPTYGPDADAGSRLILPLLRRRGEARIDHLVLSHRDSDHVGGAAALLAALPVGELLSSLESGHALLAQARQRGVPLRRCAAGQRWRVDGVSFEILHPQAADYVPDHVHAPEAGAGSKPVKPNALSCVLRITEGSEGSEDGESSDRRASSNAGGLGATQDAGAAAPLTVLLAGDIEAAQEAALLAAAAPLRAHVLLVPHHGSRTSSTAPFIDAVAPQVALVQAAYRSRFGHPAADVVARYEARGVTVVRSDRCGAYTLPSTLNGDAALQPGAGARCEREAARRYWHHRASLPAPG
jgi:competence protein ComEC